MSSPRDISLSCSIVSYHSPIDDLTATLVSLLGSVRYAREQGIPLRLEITLVDNSEQGDLAPEALGPVLARAEVDTVPLQILRGHGNVGYGRGHNLAIHPSRSDYFLVLNPDVVLDPVALTAGITYLQTHPDIVIASPYAEDRDGRRQYLNKRHPALLTLWVRGFLPAWLQAWFKGHLARYEMHDLPADEPHHDVPLVSGCFMLCRTAALRQVGGFDEGYFLYFEDFDLSLRMARAGRLAYVPAMRIRHGGGHSARKGWRHILMFMRSGIRFFNAWGWKFIQ